MASISTGKGDAGETSLLFGQRVSKAALRVRFYGAMDEVAVHLTAARAVLPGPDSLLVREVQERFVYACSEAATPPDRFEDFARKFPSIGPEDCARLETEITALEEAGISFGGWVEDIDPRYVHLELARAVMRRAESLGVELSQKEKVRPELLAYLNRLSDFFWILARKPSAQKIVT